MKFNDELVYCPCCGKELRQKAIKIHVNSRARGELWKKEFFGEKDTSHLDYLKEHAQVKRRAMFVYKQ